MTKLLERAVAEIEKLPEDAQDAIAARLLADLADEQAWAARFAATTDAQFDFHRIYSYLDYPENLELHLI